MNEPRGVNEVRLRYKQETGNPAQSHTLEVEHIKIWMVISEWSNQELIEELKLSGSVKLVDPAYVKWLEEQVVNNTFHKAPSRIKDT